MTTITTRVNKTSELTYAQGDDNVSRDVKTAVADPAPIVFDDNRAVYECTGTFDFTLISATSMIAPAASALADDFEITIKNVSTGIITVKTTAPDTLDGVAATGDKAIAAGEAFTYKVNDAKDGWISVAKVTFNGISSSAVVADNVLVRGDGGVRNVQGTGITVADTTDNVSGMGTLGCGAITSSGTIGGTTITASVGFSGDITGDVTGNADTATALETARTIGGVSFDGTANIVPATITVSDESSDTSCNVLFATQATGNLPPKSGTNLTFNSSTGALTATSLTISTDLTVPNGGTGRSSFTDNGVVYGDVANPLDVTAAGATGEVLTGTTGAAPSFKTGSLTILTGLMQRTISPAQTEYSFPMGYTTSFSIFATGHVALCPYAGVIKALFAEALTNSLSGTATITLMVNQVATALTVTITAGSTATFSDVSNSVAVSAGDQIGWRTITSAGTGTMIAVSVSANYAAN